MVFLLGAGASIDAGLPSVEQLTIGLRERLPGLSDMNGKPRPEFPALFDALAHYDREISGDYERFFQWLALLRQAQKDPFKSIVRFDLGQDLVRAAGELVFCIKLPIWEILRERHQGGAYRPDYLVRLDNFLPAKGRLKVFTLNYDLCVEDGCAARGISVITGFSMGGKRWMPSRFDTRTHGINLYKLHGSVNWVQSNLGLRESYPPQWDKEPQLLLGPGSKLQHDEPFVTLYSEFHKALRRAKVCVAVGYSFRDAHIREPLCEATRRGLKVIEVNPSKLETGFVHRKKIPLRARDAFETGAILDAVSRADSNQLAD